MYTFVGTTPSVSIVPINYRGLDIDYEDEVECNDFPQCCYATDSYKAWLAQNGSSIDAAWKATQDSLNIGVASRVASFVWCCPSAMALSHVLPETDSAMAM